MKNHPLLSCLLVATMCGTVPRGFSQAPAPGAPPKAVPADPAAPASTTTAATEDPAVLRASSVLIPELVAGPLHRVRELVPTDGYLAHFTIDSEFGTFEVTGSAQLGTCIGEIQAIAKLNSVSRSDLFADGLKRSLEQPVDAAKNIVQHPVDTVKTLPGTVGHFFKKLGNSVGNAATSINDRADERQATGGNQAAGTAQDVGRASGGVGRGIIGFDSAKLECARQLGVDPYTDNPRLKEEIDKVAWVFFAGGLPMKAAGIATGAGLAVGAATMAGLPDEVYALTPGELALRNNQAMEAMAVPAATGQAFNSNPALTPSLGRSILASLEALPGAAGRAEAVALAAGCTTRQQARFLSQALAILAKCQAAGGAPVTEIKVLGRLPAAVDANGALLVPLPSDYVSWTPETAAFAQREDLTAQLPMVLHTGLLSPMTVEQLKRLGWITVQL